MATPGNTALELGLAGRRALVTGAGKGGPAAGDSWGRLGRGARTDPLSPQASGAARSRRCTRLGCRWWR